MNETRKTFLPRILIGAEKSGGGKTMLVCALLSLLAKDGGQVFGFKCGPDYIDPMFHRQVLGIPSYNLDSFFSDQATLSYLLGRHGCSKREKTGSIAILEGVMGYYDGLGGSAAAASAWEIGRLTKTPAVLLVDGSGRGISSLASLKGFLEFKEDSGIAGVIFNRVSAGLYPSLKKEAERLGVSSYGYIPKLEGLELKSRHLGLVLPEEVPELRETLTRLAEAVRPGIDLDGLVELANQAPPLSWQEPFSSYDAPSITAADGAGGAGQSDAALFPAEEPQTSESASHAGISGPAVAVARDEAFCFYYADNLELLEAMGARLLFFSPLRDREVPKEADAIYLGGGYPELHGKELSQNQSMRNDIRKKVLAGMPCIAECGGYLYLAEKLEDKEGRLWPMAGVLEGTGRSAGRLRRFGYLTLTAKKDGLLGPAGTKLPAHEFHYWDTECLGTDFRGEKPYGGRSWDCGYLTDSLYAGFPHLYFYGNLEVPRRFLRMAMQWKLADQKNGRIGQ